MNLITWIVGLILVSNLHRRTGGKGFGGIITSIMKVGGVLFLISLFGPYIIHNVIN